MGTSQAGVVRSHCLKHYSKFCHFVDGYCLFLSEKTRAKTADTGIITKEGGKSKLNFVINFEIFIEDYTGFNILIWLKKIHKKATTKPSYVGHHCVDGDNNAGAYVKDCKFTTNRKHSKNIKGTKCQPHRLLIHLN